MPWFDFDFDYTGNAPSTGKTRNLLTEDLGYDEENIKVVTAVNVQIEGSSADNIADAINDDLPITRSGTKYTSIAERE